MTPRVRKPKLLTVAEALVMLNKIDDKSLPVYFDCPYCGRANSPQEVNHIVLVKTGGQESEMEP